MTLRVVLTQTVAMLEWLDDSAEERGLTIVKKTRRTVTVEGDRKAIEALRSSIAYRAEGAETWPDQTSAETRAARLAVRMIDQVLGRDEGNKDGQAV